MCVDMGAQRKRETRLCNNKNAAYLAMTSLKDNSGTLVLLSWGFDATSLGKTPSAQRSV